MYWKTKAVAREGVEAWLYTETTDELVLCSGIEIADLDNGAEPIPEHYHRVLAEKIFEGYADKLRMTWANSVEKTSTHPQTPPYIMGSYSIWRADLLSAA